MVNYFNIVFLFGFMFTISANKKNKPASKKDWPFTTIYSLLEIVMNLLNIPTEVTFPIPTSEKSVL